MALLSNRTYRRARAAVLAASDVCWICGHPGADQTDHVVPTSVRPELYDDPANLRPAHGQAGCPYCRIKCNQARGNRDTFELRPPTNSRRW